MLECFPCGLLGSEKFRVSGKFAMFRWVLFVYCGLDENMLFHVSLLKMNDGFSY